MVELEALLAPVRANRVTELSLIGKDLTDAQGITVAEALDGNTRVLKLHLQYNSELTDADRRAAAVRGDLCQSGTLQRHVGGCEGRGRGGLAAEAAGTGAR